jgi:hypothetical protein
MVAAKKSLNKPNEFFKKVLLSVCRILTKGRVGLLKRGDSVTKRVTARPAEIVLITSTTARW